MSINGKITFHNSFHNTEVNVVVKEGRISQGQLNRVRRELCGVTGCCCGNVRGHQQYMLVEDVDSWGRADGAQVIENQEMK